MRAPGKQKPRTLAGGRATGGKNAAHGYAARRARRGSERSQAPDWSDASAAAAWEALLEEGTAG